MSIKEVTMYAAVCDGCGVEQGEGDDIVAWESADSALNIAEDSDWKKQDDGRLFCSDCRFDRPDGDRHELAEELVP